MSEVLRAIALAAFYKAWHPAHIHHVIHIGTAIHVIDGVVKGWV